MQAIRSSHPHVRSIAGLFLAAVATWCLAAPPLPEAAPESVGMSAERLGRIAATMQRAVDSGEIPGAVAMVARRGKLVYQTSVGYRDFATSAPMTADAIFRIYSMTKPIATVAAMILVEEGRLSLDEPLSKHLPEFKDMQVAHESFDPVTGAQTFYTTPARRPITIQDLMRHTSGFTYGVLGAPTAVKKMYNDAKIFSQKWVLADFTKALAKIPLAFEPGTTFEYSHSTDVLGRVVEVVSGETLDAFIRKRILDPLAMKDTAFQLSKEKFEQRMAQPRPDPVTKVTPDMLDLREPQTLFAGGHGLVSTASDYIRFCQMMLDGGILDGQRILGPRTVAYMSSNHLNPNISPGPLFIPGPGYGFGLGFAVRREAGQSDWPGSVGEYFWAGAGGTYFWIDPKEQLIAVLMTQEPTRRQHYRNLYRDLVYQSIVD